MRPLIGRFARFRPSLCESGNSKGWNLSKPQATNISWEKWVPLVTERNDS